MPANLLLKHLRPKRRQAKGNAHKSALLHTLTTAALALPGLVLTPAQAADDEVDFQWSHYQEGKRDLINKVNKVNPIEVESLQGSSKVKLTDRIKFAFNYTQDTWSGATPVATAPLSWGGNRTSLNTGASPLLQGSGAVSLDRNFKPLQTDQFGQLTGRKDTQLVHTLSSASPETRNQGDFRLAYELDNAELSAGGGVSVENDYESDFGNLGGRFDFNNKLTTLDVGLSYTSSDTHAIVDHDAAPYFYEAAEGYPDFNNRRHNYEIQKTEGNYIITGQREDWSANLGLTQVINKNALFSTSISATRSHGYLSNPYKAVSVAFIDPAQQSCAASSAGGYCATILAVLENRPEERNQGTWNARFIQNFEPINGALHLDYRYYRDDWGISAHTFSGDWAQSLGAGWTLTPRVRYYSQGKADFYTPYLVTQGVDQNGKFDPRKLPAFYSSDQRLSGFGTLSGGITLSKRFTKGISLELGAEYYTHKGSLKIGGGGEGDYANFDSYQASAGLKVDFAALNAPGGDHSAHHHSHHHHSQAPAGVMFSHTLDKAGDSMIGYRFMHGSMSGDMLRGTHNASDPSIVAGGCGAKPCYITPTEMTMNMHMLDLMYAPTDWLTLMLMPQFMDMHMNMRQLNGAPAPTYDDFKLIEHHTLHEHTTSGFGDTSAYAMFKVFNRKNHHVHATLGISAPTGDVGIRLRDNHRIDVGYYHYGMQLGSGTWDFKPSVTYTGEIDRWSWGAQMSGTKRLQDQNKSNYALGDVFQTTAWGAYSIYDWLSASFRGIYTVEGTIKGEYQGVYHRLGPVDYSSNYGGRYWDIGMGLSATVPTGDLQGNRFGVEWVQPLSDDVNGYQLPRQGTINASWNYGF